MNSTIKKPKAGDIVISNVNESPQKPEMDKHARLDLSTGFRSLPEGFRAGYILDCRKDHEDQECFGAIFTPLKPVHLFLDEENNNLSVSGGGYNTLYSDELRQLPINEWVTFDKASKNPYFPTKKKIHRLVNVWVLETLTENYGYERFSDKELILRAVDKVVLENTVQNADVLTSEKFALNMCKKLRQHIKLSHSRHPDCEEESIYISEQNFSKTFSNTSERLKWMEQHNLKIVEHEFFGQSLIFK